MAYRRGRKPPAADPSSLGYWLVVGLVVFAIFMSMMAWASAHEWYPSWCCNDADCKPLDPRRVRALEDGGYEIDGRFNVPPTEVKQSLDGRYHACFPEQGKLRCFFAPGRGM